MRRLTLSVLSFTILMRVGFAQSSSDPYGAVSGYTIDKPHAATAAIETEIQHANPAQLRDIEEKLLKLLRAPETTKDSKAWICRQMRQIGTDRAVAAIVPLLADKDVATYARWALQSIAGEAAAAALRDAVAKLQGELRTGVIVSLGVRQDRDSVPLLAPLVADADAAVAEAALRSLGKIGGSAALKALQDAKVPAQLQSVRDDAVLRCADAALLANQNAAALVAYNDIFKRSQDTNLKSVALRGLILAGKGDSSATVMIALKSDCPRLRRTAAKLLCEAEDRALLAAVLGAFLSLPPDSQAAILDLVNEETALAVAASSSQHGDEAVRSAAIGALGRIGDASAILPLLARAAAGEGDSQTARASLRQLKKGAVCQSLAGVAQKGNSGVRVEAIRALVSRNEMEAASSLLRVANDTDASVATEALVALGKLAKADLIPELIKLLPDSARRSAAESAIVAVCHRAADQNLAAESVAAALPGPNVEVRSSLLRVLGHVPVTKSLEVLRAASKDSDAVVKDIAVRCLSDWPDDRALDDLRGIVQTDAGTVHRALALRGYIRIASLPKQRSAAATAKLFSDAMGMATAVDEKKLVLAALGDLNNPAALQLAESCLGDKAVEVEAATAAVRIGKKLRTLQPDILARVSEKMIKVCQSDAARRLAEVASSDVSGMTNIAGRGVATSPDGLEKDGAAGGDQAAIDGNPATYWDEKDGEKLYRLVVTFKDPERVAAISVVGYAHHNFAPKDFEIICDGKVLKSVRDAQYDENLLIVTFAEISCRTLELKITGCYGRSPAIRELGIYQPKLAAK